MHVINYQEEFTTLYEANKEEILSLPKLCTGKLNGPFLISPSHLYRDASLKVVFVGQETKGWTCHENIKQQMGVYENFGFGREYRASPFFNVIRKLEKRLSIQPFGSIWLNLNRYDQNEGRPKAETRELLSSLDYILTEELSILSPDLVVFFTGPIYDQRIGALLNAKKTKIPGFEHRVVCEYILQSGKPKTLRTYHPAYLRRANLEKSVLSAIVSIAGIREDTDFSGV